jgi:hypothetical protein
MTISNKVDAKTIYDKLSDQDKAVLRRIREIRREINRDYQGRGDLILLCLIDPRYADYMESPAESSEE